MIDQLKNWLLDPSSSFVALKLNVVNVVGVAAGWLPTIALIITIVMGLIVIRRDLKTSKKTDLEIEKLEREKAQANN